MNNDKILYAAGLLVAVQPLSAQTKPTSRVQQPNIIHIMTDDHALQAISCLGHPIAQLAPTPNIDRIGREGAIFENAFVVNSISAPSRATLLTGKYTHVNGQMVNGQVFDPTQQTFVKLLHDNGYQTAVIGKWHLQSKPAGFDYFKVLWDQGEYYNPAFATPETNGEYVKEEGYVTNIITRDCIDWIEHRDPNKPFCLLMHHKAPHRNWMPEPKYMDLYEDVEFPYPPTLFDDFATRSEAPHTCEMSIDRFMTLGYDLKVDSCVAKEPARQRKLWEDCIGRMTPEQREAWYVAYGPKNEKFLEMDLSGEELVKWKYQRYVKDYLRCIKSVDDSVGEMLAYLEKEGLLDNTIIVYTSDQGFYMGEHGWYDKRFMYEESLRMPMLMRYPAKIKAGTRVSALVQNIDYAPTYLDLAGIEVPADIQGCSVQPLLDGETPDFWRKYIYYHYYEYPAMHQVRRHYGVRDARYKLIHFYGKGRPGDTDNLDEWELYDLAEDPIEVHNLYSDPRYDQEIRRLKKAMDSLRQEFKVIDEVPPFSRKK